jgi:hypothetical protein
MYTQSKIIFQTDDSKTKLENSRKFVAHVVPQLATKTKFDLGLTTSSVKNMTDKEIDATLLKLSRWISFQENKIAKELNCMDVSDSSTVKALYIDKVS